MIYTLQFTYFLILSSTNAFCWRGCHIHVPALHQVAGNTLREHLARAPGWDDMIMS